MQSNKFFQIIYGLAEISLDTTTGTVTFTEHGKKNNNQIDIRYFESITVNNRFLWKRLNLTYRIQDKNRIVKLSGFNPVECDDFIKKLRQLVNEYAHKLVEELSEKSYHSKLEYLKTEFKKHGYIRRSHVQNIISTVNLPVLEYVPFLISQIFSHYSSVETKQVIQHAFCKIRKVYAEIELHNSKFCDEEVINYSHLFDAIERYSLNYEQRMAIVHDEDANLVVAGAGTGKTSTIVGKVAYLLEKKICNPNEILLLAYNSNAAAEIKQRIKAKCKLNVEHISTFHAFGLGIVGEANKLKPNVSVLATDHEKLKEFILSSLTTIFKDANLYQTALEFFAYYLKPIKLEFEFENPSMLNEYRKQMVTFRDKMWLFTGRRTVKRELVKSNEECRIANFLFINGIDYKYEADYKIQVGDKYRRQYKPDFYLPDYDIYIEHFGVDRKNHTASFVNNSQYLQDMENKRRLHLEHGTTLIETYSYEHQEETWQKLLMERLKSKGVRFNPISFERVKEIILEPKTTNRFTSLIMRFLHLFKAGGLTKTEIEMKTKRSLNKLRTKVFLSIFEQIYSMYNSNMKSKNEIDFDDMLYEAISNIQGGVVQCNFKYIIIDEFQDISMSRLRLVKAVLEKNPGSSLFCVGDDWQSIYRFAGADYSIMTDFASHFGYYAKLILSQTYRFPNDLASVSAEFVQKNPHQLKKVLHSDIKADDSSICVIKYAYCELNEETQAVWRAFAEIEKLQKGLEASVFILGRYKNLEPNIREFKRNYPYLKIKFMTCHKSKGLEADFVIILGLTNHLMGFPSQIENDPLIDLCLSDSDSFDYSEERRLFYVAMTRAKRKLFLCTPDINDSVFIKELMNAENTNISYIELDNVLTPNQLHKCKECGTGFYVKRKGSHGVFWGCSNYPYCRSIQEKVCTNEQRAFNSGRQKDW